MPVIIDFITFRFRQTTERILTKRLINVAGGEKYDVVLGYVPAYTTEEAIEETAYWTAKQQRLIG